MSNGNGNDVDIHIRGKVDGSLKTAAVESKNTIADLKGAVVDNAAQMTGVSRDLLSAVSDLAPRFLLVGDAAAVMIKAYADGVAEVKAMNLAIGMGGDISGQTAASMRGLADEMASSSRMTIAQSKEVASAMATSGQIGGAAFEKVGRIAGDFARVMGTDVARVGPELVKLFDDPAKGAEELNKRMHFLSAAELDHIEHLTRMGDVTQAQIELAGKLGDRMGEIVPKLGLVERAWDGVKGASSKAWDAMMGVGREQTTKERLDAVYDRIITVQKMGAGARNLPTDKQVPALRQEVLRLQEQLAAETGKTFAKSEAAEKNRRDQSGRSMANRLSKTAAAEAIDDEIKLLEAADLRADIKSEAIAKKREERAKLFAEKKSGGKTRDSLADTLNEAAGVNRNFTEQLAGLKAGLDGGRVSEEAYVATVAALINKQPFATKALQEMNKELALKEQVQHRVAAADKAAAAVVDAANASHAQRSADLQFEIDLLGKNAAERARLTEFRKIDLQLARDMQKVADTSAPGDVEGISEKQGQLERAAEKAKTAVVDSHGAMTVAERDWRSGAIRGIQDYAAEAVKSASNMANAFKQGAKMAEDAIANFVATGKLDISSLARFAVTEMARENVAKPLVSVGTDWLKGLLKNADGNVFSSPDLHRYANTIVSSPTLFRFAQGGAFQKGLMGEAGPEAILPLARGANGKLGVQASGAAETNIRVEIINPPGRPAQVESVTQRIDAKGVVVSVVLSDIANNGPIAQGMAARYGLRGAAA